METLIVVVIIGLFIAALFQIKSINDQEFEKWFDTIIKIVTERGMSPEQIELIEQSEFWELYKNGLSPEEAIEFKRNEGKLCEDC